MELDLLCCERCQVVSDSFGICRIFDREFFLMVYRSISDVSSHQDGSFIFKVLVCIACRINSNQSILMIYQVSLSNANS